MAGRAERGMLEDAAYLGLAGLFYVAPRLLYDIHVAAPPVVTFSPSMLIVANHKRDLDSVVLTSTLYWLQASPRRPLWFAGREDMFLRGFLAGYDVVPRWLRRLLYEMDLTAVMRALRVLPVRRFPERSMAEALQEALAVLGDRPLLEVLTDEAAAEVLRRGGAALPLSQALGWAYYDCWRIPARMRAFREPGHTVLEERQREVVRAQITRLAAVLDGGGVLYLAPEGVISPDGRLQAFRSGLRQVLEATVRPVDLRPAAIVYDFMKPGRLRIFISVGGPVMAGAPEASAEVARRRLAALHVMTATQLCSYLAWRWWTAGRRTFRSSDLAGELALLAAHLAGQGVAVDPGLRRTPEQRAAEWLRYARRRALVDGAADACELTGALEAQPIAHWSNPVRYAVNELTSVCAALDVPLDGRARPAAEAASG